MSNTDSLVEEVDEDTFAMEEVIHEDTDVLEDENGRVAMLLADRSLNTFGPDDSNIGMQRGDPGRKDWYSFATVTLSIRLTKPQGTCWENSHFR